MTTVGTAALAAITVFTLTFLACATTAERSWRGVEGQECRASTEQISVVDLVSMFDAGKPTSPIPVGATPDTLLVFVAYDSAGVLSRVSAHGRLGQRFDDAAVSAALRERFTARGEAASVAFGLYVRGGDPDLRSHRPGVGCEPRLINTRDMHRHLSGLANDPRAYDRGAVARLRIGGEGEVTDARIDRSSGDIGIDREMLRVARLARFAPALQDGFVVPVWVALPLGVRPRPIYLRPGECPPEEVLSIPCLR